MSYIYFHMKTCINVHVYLQESLYMFCMHLYLVLFPMILFVCHFASPWEDTVGTVSQLCHFLYLSVCFCTVWPSTFSEKSDCDYLNLFLSTIGIFTILVKLLQMIWGYVLKFKAWAGTPKDTMLYYSLLDTGANKNGCISKNNENVENFPP